MPYRPIFNIVLISFTLLSGIVACKFAVNKDQPANPSKDKPVTEMPVPPLPPAPGDYADDWKIVDSLDKQGLFKSALERVEAIQVKAQNDKNSPQVLKALIFRGKYTTTLEEDGFVEAIKVFEAEEKNANIPTRALLQSILGQLYSTYLSNKGWQLSERTPIPDGEGGDILTWSAAQIEQHALDLYFASVERRPILLETPVETFRSVVTPGQNDTIDGKALRPMLYDLLAHRALEHFANERSWLTEPAYAFKLDQPQAFAPLQVFLKTDFTTRDSASNKWLAIKTFQRLLSQPALVNITPGKPAEVTRNHPALVANDLLRLEFAWNNSVREDKDSLYLQALENLHRQSANDHTIDAEIVYAMASFLYYRDKGDKGQNAQKAALMCEDIILQNPDTYGARQCLLLLNEIRGKNLNIEVENAILPGKSAPVLLQFRNIQRFHVRVVQGNFSPDFLQDINWEKRLDFVRSLPQVQQRVWDLKVPGDYQHHRTEIALDALPLGSYWVLVCENEDFDEKKGPVAFAPFSVTELAAVPMRNHGTLAFALVHRNTGAPLAGVKLEAFGPKYQRKDNNNPLQTMITDRNGLVRADWEDHSGGEVRATLNGDSLWLGNFYHYRYRSDDDLPMQVYFFTDRALYRPGQTVYFKGVLFRYDDARKPQIVTNKSVAVTLYDVNGQAKGTLQLRSNDYGTFNGVFTAPANGLTGQMSIRVDHALGGATFNVEEYKRPKFEVVFAPVKDAFRLGEKVTLHGEAKAYAGSNIDGAQVRYRVVRQARFPFWNWGWGTRRKYIPWQTDQMEITSGVTTTDADGKFAVGFTAIPDPAIPRKENPQFDYTVFADVTDISGETRSTQQFVSAGYVALKVDWGLGSEIDLDSLRHVSLNTYNLANQPQATEGRITLQPLVAPKPFFVERYWEVPDVPAMSKETWKNLLPDYAWQDEANPEKWPRADFILPFSFNTGRDKTVDLNGGNAQAGYYLARLTTADAYGEKVEIEKIVRVWDKKNRATQFETPSAAVEKSTLEPGETARIWLGGKPAGLNIFYARQQHDTLAAPRWLNVDGATSVEIPVVENDRGGIIAYWFTVKNNRFYGGRPLSLNVPWSNKLLNIQYETFRDKLAPGQQEEWRLRISGPGKEKVAAEMVATLYDASLDQFLPHDWSAIPYPANYPRVSFEQRSTLGSRGGEVRYDPQNNPEMPVRTYPELNWFDFPLWGGRLYRSRNAYDNDMNIAFEAAAAPGPGGGEPSTKRKDLASDAREEVSTNDLNPYRGNLFQGNMEAGAPVEKPKPAPPVQIRSNLNETVFFFPELHTDKEGNVVLKFRMNEALTRWKLLTYAHTRDLKQALSTKEVVTQKELMVQANAPRFLRAGDEMEFSAKVSNLSQETVSGSATLHLFDAGTMQPVDRAFGLTAAVTTTYNFTVLSGRSMPLSWKIRVPDDFSGAVTWQVIADGKKFRDGEESTIPVVSNRMLVTETLPISVRGGQTKEFVFENLKNAGKSTSLKTRSYTLEFTSNPVWYAVQSLPYLMEFPYDCSEQVFSRFYANTLAASVTEKLPNIRRVYDRWKGKDAMKSNLSKNQELKYALLEETPWVLDAQSEEQQKQNIALLFDLNRMSDERERALRILSERQMDNGGWAWFPGGQDSWYITQHIVSGFGHLKQLGAFDGEQDPQAAQMLDRAVGYCDAKLASQYRELELRVQQGKAKWDDDHLDGMAIQYLYARSFFPQQLDKPGREMSYYLDQAEKFWLGKGLYQEGMLALALHRNGRTDASGRIVASLRERALVKEELGMYWPVDWGFYWYQLPVETQALMVEVFGEAGNDPKAVEELRIWLLKNKQTNRWESTKATSEAVYALLLFGDNWLQNTRPVQVALGGKSLKPEEYEPGTGYFKQTWNDSAVNPSFSTIKIENPNTNIVWGAAYWQYFEDLDKITDFQKTPLTIVKQLFTEENSPTGPVLKPVADGQALKRGDKIKVRIEIRADRAMEFVHLKDMRAAGFEPVNVLSGYRWKDGLGYYESTKDLATHFFIDYLPRGTFVFEYPLVVSHKGEMSNGITTMQCMYAPEFTSHSKGVRVKVE
jgi:hypothetical protein